MTHLQLVTEALELAGNTGLAPRAQTWLGLVMRHLNEKFSFPFGPSRKAIVDLAAGDSSVTVGSAIGGSADVFGGTPVRGIDRVLIYTENLGSDWTELHVTDFTRVLPSEGSIGGQTGRPHTVVVEPRNPVGGFTLKPIPIADANYQLLVVVSSKGLATPTYSASAVNEYPDDFTILQGVYAMALKHQQDERAPAEWSEFMRMAKEDRVRYGNQGGRENSRVELGGPHRTRSFDNRGPGWMGPV